MNKRIHGTRSLAIAFAGLLLLGLGNAGIASAQQTEQGAAPVRCEWTVEELPRTPDAVEGWYRGCASPTLPHSPTGVEGWNT